LIHWNAEEAAPRLAALEKAGYQVDFDMFGPQVLQGLQSGPPASVVIDLSRLPMQGRDVGLAVRHYKATRHVPIVFADGAEEKVAKVKQSLPDAVFTTWKRIRSAVKEAIANPPKQPVAPRSLLEGYARAPLVKKLGIKEGSKTVLIGAPPGFEKTLGQLPQGTALSRHNRGQRGLTIWFVRSRKEFEDKVGRMAARVVDDGLWIAWPKKTSALASDLTQAVVRRIGLDSGLVDYKVCAIDDTWTGLKFSRRRSK
jgi:hypothetical protein